MAGFNGQIVLANNIQIDGSQSGSGDFSANGQLLIGGVASPNMAVGIPTASNGVALTLGQNSLAVAGVNATDAVVGVVELATDAETIAGTDSVRGVVPSGLAAKLGAQTANAIPYAAGPTAAMAYLGPLTDGQLIIGSTGAAPVAAQLIAGAGTTISAGPGTITISSTASGDNWTAISASQTLSPNNSYLCVAPGGALSLALPAVAAQFTRITVALEDATSFVITQGAGQQIRLGSQLTTAGAAGSLASTAQGDVVSLVCSVADTKWIVDSAVGNLTLV
jgi:hypothetical protein